ncbi:hypothetical protein ACFPYJ_22740 [Paenibacillus solisilvae]|uniref:Spore protein n=1 Tax=Paenibacillus solisilvae TaxID=2486751 RepID=A0ABW0W623_9BACL
MEQNQQSARSKSSSKQSAFNNRSKQADKAPESEGFDKKLDGPNRPSI